MPATHRGACAIPLDMRTGHASTSDVVAWTQTRVEQQARGRQRLPYDEKKQLIAEVADRLLTDAERATLARMKKIHVPEFKGPPPQMAMGVFLTPLTAMVAGAAIGLGPLGLSAAALLASGAGFVTGLFACNAAVRASDNAEAISKARSAEASRLVDEALAGLHPGPHPYR